MKKNFKFYAIIWAILLTVFNVLCFATPNEMGGFVKIDSTFWVAYAFITAAFIGNLVCAFFAFRADNLQKMFYNLPLLTIGWTALIVMLIAGAATMAIPNLPSWIGMVVCLLALAFNAIAVVKAVWAADTVNKVDEKVKVKTAYIKNLTVDTEGILARAKSEPVKAECKKVYEAVRYSDPMSNEALSVIEAKITVKVDELASAVGADDAEKAKEIADEIVILVGDRNKKCKALKG